LEGAFLSFRGPEVEPRPVDAFVDIEAGDITSDSLLFFLDLENNVDKSNRAGFFFVDFSLETASALL
jgi:hypothetical protein